MSEFNKFVYLKGKEFKKVKKIKSRLKKITLISYKNSSTYLYNRNSDFIIISCSVDINKDKMLTEKSNKTAEMVAVEQLSKKLCSSPHGFMTLASHYLKNDDFTKLSETINEIKAMLIALINKVREASKT